MLPSLEDAAPLLCATIAGWTLSQRGLKKNSLDASGARAAFWVGTLILGSSFSFGLVLIVFYLSGSTFTRWKEGIKARYDKDVRGGGGQRTAVQVLCTAGVGTLLSVLYVLARGYDSVRLLGVTFDVAVVRLAAAQQVSFVRDALAVTMPKGEVAALRLALAFLGSFACVNGDTWASELGILSPAPPRLVTSCQRVPRGTNGGMSPWGTALSAAGGAAIGAVVAADPYVRVPWLRLVSMVQGRAQESEGRADWRVQVALIVLGAATGLGGSLIDSLLGATVQRSWYEASTGRCTAVLPAGCKESRQRYSEALLEQGERAAAGEQKKSDRSSGSHSAERELVVISGYPLLSNEGVNLASNALTALLTAWLGPVLLVQLVALLSSA